MRTGWSAVWALYSGDGRHSGTKCERMIRNDVVTYDMMNDMLLFRCMFVCVIMILWVFGAHVGAFINKFSYFSYGSASISIPRGAHKRTHIHNILELRTVVACDGIHIFPLPLGHARAHTKLQHIERNAQMHANSSHNATVVVRRPQPLAERAKLCGRRGVVVNRNDDEENCIN